MQEFRGRISGAWQDRQFNLIIPRERTMST
jgi:hypothetical protein